MVSSVALACPAARHGPGVGPGASKSSPRGCCLGLGRPGNCKSCVGGGGSSCPNRYSSRALKRQKGKREAQLSFVPGQIGYGRPNRDQPGVRLLQRLATDRRARRSGYFLGGLDEAHWQPVQTDTEDLVKLASWQAGRLHTDSSS